MMTPEQLVDDLYEVWGEHLEMIPPSQHKDIFIGILAKSLMAKQLEVEFLLKRIERTTNEK